MESSLETLDRRVPCRSNPDPLDLDPEEVLDKLDVLLTVLGQGFESGAFRNVGFPPGEGSVFDFDLGEEVKVGYETESEQTAGYRISINAEVEQTNKKERIRLTREPFDLLPINLVTRGDLDLLEPIEHVELGQVERGVPVDHGRITHDDEIEPTRPPPSTGRDTPFGTDFLQLDANVLLERASYFGTISLTISITFD